MSETARPLWPFKVPEDFARWLAGGSVTKITHHWRFTGVDTSEDWIEFHIGKEARRCPVRLDQFGEIAFLPDHRQLVRLRGDVRERLQEIAAWETRESKDIAEYKRLARKLYGRMPTPSEGNQ